MADGPVVFRAAGPVSVDSFGESILCNLCFGKNYSVAIVAFQGFAHAAQMAAPRRARISQINRVGFQPIFSESAAIP